MTLATIENQYYSYLKDYEGLKRSSIQTHKKYIKEFIVPMIGSIEITELTLLDIARVSKAVSDKYGKNTNQAHEITRPLRGMFQYTEALGERVRFSLTKMKRVIPSRPRLPIDFYSLEELELIRGAFDLTTFHGLRHRTVFEVGIYTGIRKGEILPLKLSDIDFESNRLSIINSKTGADEYVELGDSIIWLQDYLTLRKSYPGDALWIADPSEISGKVRQLSYYHFSKYFTKIAHELELEKGISLTLTRKTYCTYLARNEKIPLIQLRALMRHSDIRVTERSYAGYRESWLQNAHNSTLNPIFSQGIKIQSSF